MVQSTSNTRKRRLQDPHIVSSSGTGVAYSPGYTSYVATESVRINQVGSQPPTKTTLNQEQEQAQEQYVSYPYFESMDSAIYRTSPNVRNGHISALWPLTSEDAPREASLSFMYEAAVAYLAMEHFNARSGAIAPELPGLLEGCDFQLSIDFRDTRFNSFVGVQGLMDACSGETSAPGNSYMKDQQGVDNAKMQVQHISSENPEATERPQRTVAPRTEAPRRTLPPRTSAPDSPYVGQGPRHGDSRSRELVNKDRRLDAPFAILGSAFSSATQTIGILSSALQLPMVSPSATSAALDETPLFARTITTNQGDARAMMIYLQSIQVHQVGILYYQDTWGVNYHNALLQEAQEFKIEIVLSVPYKDDNLETSIQSLASAQLRYYIGLISIDNWKPAVRMAYQYGIMGTEDNTWYLAELSEMLLDDFALDRETESDIALALHGTGNLLMEFKDNQVFDEVFSDMFTNQTMIDHFVSLHVEPEIYDNVTFNSPSTSYFMYLMYDAMLALGLAGCAAPGHFTGNEFYSHLLTNTFQGASGWVALDEKTGTRMPSTAQYRLQNFVISENQSTSSEIRFDSRTSIIMSEDTVREVNPFVFFDNSTVAATALPALEGQDYNLIPQAALIFGWIFALLIVLASVSCMVWTACNRERYVVKASQPIFLCQICLGTFVMAASILPMSMQEETDGGSSQYDLDKACMATPWLLFTGFVIAFSAIFSKTWRLNKLMSSSHGMRRIQVRARDAICFFVLMMTLTVVLLVACTIVAPFRWTRVPIENRIDFFGRVIESYGTCRPAANDDKTTFYFVVPLVVLNMTGVFFAAYQAYLARNIPTEFSESSYLSLAMISLMETLILGGPILFTVHDNPTSNFLIQSSLVNIACLSILVPIFLPKYRHRNSKSPSNPMDMSSMRKARQSASRNFGSGGMDGTGTEWSTRGHMAIVARRDLS